MLLTFIFFAGGTIYHFPFFANGGVQRIILTYFCIDSTYGAEVALLFTTGSAQQGKQQQHEHVFHIPKLII